MISEVDIRDWDKVDFTPFQKDEEGRYQMVDIVTVLTFVGQVAALRDKQLKAIYKKVPAILKENKNGV